MKKLLLFILLGLPLCAFTQDCSSKIKSAQTSKANGNYRLALAQFTAAASSCGEERRTEIEKEILDIYDKIERLKDEALGSQKIARAESDKAQAAEKTAANALIEAQKASRKARVAVDSLNIVLNNLGRANADKVRLILAEVARNQRDARFDAAVDKIKTAKILRALPDSVDRAYRSLSRVLLDHAQQDLEQKDYHSALANIKYAEELGISPDAVATANRTLQNFLSDNIRLDIVNTQYDEAVEKVKALQTLNVLPVKVENAYFNIAFCYAEIGQFDRAARLFDTIAQMRPYTEGVRSMLKQLNGKEPTQKAQLLRQVRQQLNPQQNDSLIARYFPPYFQKMSWGTFNAGSDGGETKGSCAVSVNPFSLGANEVTFFEYDLFCTATNRPKPFDNGWGRGQRPVMDIDWFDAVEYCNWRSVQEGLLEVYKLSKNGINPKITDTTDQKRNWSVSCNWFANGYRLPTEAEWEFAAGNGIKHTRFAWGDEQPTAQKGGNVTDEMAKTKFPVWETFKDYSDGFAYTAPIKSFPPNDLGLYDMTGNVWEWCWDWYDENYYRGSKNLNAPEGPTSGFDRSIRGGSWGSLPEGLFGEQPIP